MWFKISYELKKEKMGRRYTKLLTKAEEIKAYKMIAKGETLKTVSIAFNICQSALSKRISTWMKDKQMNQEIENMKWKNY